VNPRTINILVFSKEEDEEDPDQRLRAHLRLWVINYLAAVKLLVFSQSGSVVQISSLISPQQVRRLRSAEDAETRLPVNHGTRAARRNRPIGEQDWIQVPAVF
jgi:hypothetical protein